MISLSDAVRYCTDEYERTHKNVAFIINESWPSGTHLVILNESDIIESERHNRRTFFRFVAVLVENIPSEPGRVNVNWKPSREDLTSLSWDVRGVSPANVHPAVEFQKK